MASTTLPNGIIVPEKFSRDWYADLYHNWQELDNLLGGGTPKDGTLTIQKNGDTVGTFSANQATNETINIEVPDVNDGTLTIQQNGTTVDTFSANSSSDKTVNIQCVDLENNQTVAGNKEFTGTTTAHDLVPSATDTYNFGSSTAQWNNAYIKSLTINGVACGDILTHNASEFVDVSSNQTIGGIKTFSNNIIISKISPFCNVYSSGYIKGQAPTSNIYSGIRFFDDINSGSANTITGGFEVEYNRDGYNKSYIASRNYAGENHKFVTVGLRVPNDDIRSIDFLPSVNGIVNLGISAVKWKSFNGVNPGALSLPRDTGLINIASSITSLDGNTVNTFTPQVDGWLLINGTGALNDGFIYAVQGRIGMISANNSAMLRCAVLIPVVAGVEVSVTCKLNAITWANIVPCQGNV
jgi:hypothetical protein